MLQYGADLKCSLRPPGAVPGPCAACIKIRTLVIPSLLHRAFPPRLSAHHPDLPFLEPPLEFVQHMHGSSDTGCRHPLEGAERPVARPLHRGPRDRDGVGQLQGQLGAVGHKTSDIRRQTSEIVNMLMVNMLTTFPGLRNPHY